MPAALALVAWGAPAVGAPGNSALADAAITFAGVADGDLTGFAVAVGDLDGDGSGDLAVGAPCSAAGATAGGAVYVVYGPLTRGRSLGEADATLVGAAAGDFLGEALATVDLDGDGVDELVTGAPGPLVGAGAAGGSCLQSPVQSGTNRPGEAYVLRGGDRRSGTAVAREVADAVITGMAPADFLGVGLSGAGDVDGDGDHDLLVGAHGPGAPPSGGGSAFIFTASLSGEVNASSSAAQLFGEAPADLAGVTVAAGDLDADRRSDVIVGAPGNQFSVERAGRVYLFHEPPAGPRSLAMADAVLEGPLPHDRAGRGLAVGNLAGDSAVDLAIGAPGTNDVYVLGGGHRRSGTVALSEAPTRVHGEDGGVGYALAMVDLEGDGTDSLAVGRPATGVPGDGGEVALFHQPDGEVTFASADARMVGVPGDNVGYALTVGDLDADRGDELVIGAVGLDGGGPGAVHVVMGARTAGRPGELPTPASPEERGPRRGAERPVTSTTADSVERGALPTTGGGGHLAALALVVAAAARHLVVISRPR